jgi:oligoendopeptidase F
MPKGTKKLGGYMKKKLIAHILVFAFILSIIAPSSAYAGISKDGNTYIVEKGDNLVEIGKELNLNWREIAEKNNITKPWMIYVGQELKIKAATVAKVPTPTVAPTNKEEAIVHGSTSFQDITYVRPDFKAITKTIQSVSPLLKQKNQEKKIIRLYDQIGEDMMDALTMNTYLNIKSSHDVTDQKTIDEVNYVASNLSSVTKLLSLLCIEILDSPYEAALREELTEEEIEDIYKASKLLTPEYIEFQTKASDLNSKYLNALSTTTIEVNGVAMSESDIYYSTDLTDAEKNTYGSQLIQNLNQTAGTIYLDLVKVYQEIAKLNGFSNVTDYMYDSYDRDYTAKETQQFSKYVKLYIVPLYHDLASTWTQEEVDLINAAPSAIADLESSFVDYYGTISDEMLEAYNYMKKFGLNYISASPVQQRSCYTTYLDSLEEPYLSIYTYGNYMDVSRYVHEFGHYNAFYVNGSELRSNLDICEIHSQANELLFLPYYQAYGKAYSPIVKNQILTMLSTIINGCVYDEFQQYVYSNDVTSVKELNQAFFNIECEYGLADASTGYTQDYSWIYVSHTFQQPLYYISYAMSAIPALEIFTDSLTDREAAIDTYNEVVNLGTEFSFQELLKDTGLSSPFKKATFYNLTEALSEFFKLNEEEAKPAA